MLLGTAKAGFLVALASGCLLFTARAADYLHNPFVLIKFGLLAIALLNIFFARRSGAWHRALKDLPVGTRVRISAAVSLTAWLGVMFAGRFIGYR